MEVKGRVSENMAMTSVVPSTKLRRNEKKMQDAQRSKERIARTKWNKRGFGDIERHEEADLCLQEEALLNSAECSVQKMESSSDESSNSDEDVSCDVISTASQSVTEELSEQDIDSLQQECVISSDCDDQTDDHNNSELWFDETDIDDDFDDDEDEDYWGSGAFFIRDPNLPKGREQRFQALHPAELYPSDLYADDDSTEDTGYVQYDPRHRSIAKKKKSDDVAQSSQCVSAVEAISCKSHIQDKEYKGCDVRFDLKSIDEAGVIEGYASVFEVVDAYGDVMKRGAFSSAIKQMENGAMPKMLWQHQPENPIGVWEHMEEDEHGLRIKGRLLLNLEKAREAYTLLKNNVLNGLSIGYIARNFDMKDGYRHLTNIDLIEVSLVTFPACTQAHLTDVKHETETITIKEENQMKEAEISAISSGVVRYPVAYKSGGEDFVHYLRHGQQKSLRQNERGGVQVPDALVHMIASVLSAHSPIRRLSSAIGINSSSVELLINSKDRISAGWMNSAVPIPDEKNYLERKKIEVHDIYARPRISQSLLDDSVLDLEDWFTDQIAAQIAMVENEAFLFGNGVDRPKGIFHDVQQYISHRIEKLHVEEKTNEKVLDALIDMTCNLPTRHLKNAKWLMSPSVFAELRKLRDRAGRHVLNNLSSAKHILLGYEVVLDETLSPQNTSNVLLAFGNFAACYQIVDRQEMSILRDPYTYKPFVEFFCNKRVGGDVVDPSAIQVLIGKMN